MEISAPKSKFNLSNGASGRARNPRNLITQKSDLLPNGRSPTSILDAKEEAVRSGNPPIKTNIA